MYQYKMFRGIFCIQHSVYSHNLTQWQCALLTDLVEGFGDGGCGCCRVLPRVECHDISGERGGRSQVNEVARSDHAAYRARNQEPLWDPLRPWEHQPLHAGAPLATLCKPVACRLTDKADDTVSRNNSANNRCQSSHVFVQIWCHISLIVLLLALNKIALTSMKFI